MSDRKKKYKNINYKALSASKTAAQYYEKSITDPNFKPINFLIELSKWITDKKSDKEARAYHSEFIKKLNDLSGTAFLISDYSKIKNLTGNHELQLMLVLNGIIEDTDRKVYKKEVEINGLFETEEKFSYLEDLKKTIKKNDKVLPYDLESLRIELRNVKALSKHVTPGVSGLIYGYVYYLQYINTWFEIPVDEKKEISTFEIIQVILIVALGGYFAQTILYEFIKSFMPKDRNMAMALSLLCFAAFFKGVDYTDLSITGFIYSLFRIPELKSFDFEFFYHSGFILYILSFILRLRVTFSTTSSAISHIQPITDQDLADTYLYIELFNKWSTKESLDELKFWASENLSLYKKGDNEDLNNNKQRDNDKSYNLLRKNIRKYLKATTFSLIKFSIENEDLKSRVFMYNFLYGLSKEFFYTDFHKSPSFADIRHLSSRYRETETTEEYRKLLKDKVIFYLNQNKRYFVNEEKRYTKEYRAESNISYIEKYCQFIEKTATNFYNDDIVAFDDFCAGMDNIKGDYLKEQITIRIQQEILNKTTMDEGDTKIDESRRKRKSAQKRKQPQIIEEKQVQQNKGGSKAQKQPPIPASLNDGGHKRARR